MTWVVLVQKAETEYDEAIETVVVGAFNLELTAEKWAERIREGYPDLTANIEWAHTPIYREALGDSLASLRGAR
jgi:hypothetical protein